MPRHRQLARPGPGGHPDFPRLPTGGFALASFLIDLKCLGVKDAFVRLDVLPSEAKERFEATLPDEGGLDAVDLDLARMLIRGGIRWSHEHRFRLPRELDRALGMIGGVGDWREADVSEFGDEDGKLHYIGSERGLRERLMDGTVDEFLGREDVVYTLGPSADFEEDYEDEEEYDKEYDDEPESAREALMDTLACQLANRVRVWCEDNGRNPNLLLLDAADVVIAVLAELDQEQVEGVASAASFEAEHVGELVAAHVASAPAVLQQPLTAAVGQVVEYMMLHSPTRETSAGESLAAWSKESQAAVPGESIAPPAGELRLRVVDEPRDGPTAVSGEAVAGKIDC